MQFSALFHDHAVLQRNISIPVWGTAAREEEVTVSLGGRVARVVTSSDGSWLVRVPALPAGGPYELTAESASGKAIARDVLVGDVWICSGQSNMEWKMAQTDIDVHADSIVEVQHMRLLTVTNPADLSRNQKQVDGRWQIADKQGLLDFSAVGAWFGRKLQGELGVPIGLICTAWGGTRIQAWISRDALMQDPAGREEIASYEAQLFSPAAGSEIYSSMADWELRGAPKDTGNAGLEKGWAAAEFNHSSWPTMPVPSRWQDHGHPGSGIFWFRRSIAIPTEWAGLDLELHLGQIDKHDDTWVNGERVGGLSWEAGPNSWCTPRVYPISARLAGSGSALAIAVRARSHHFHGGLIGSKQEMYVVPVGATKDVRVPLPGAWHYTVEQDWGLTQPKIGLWGPGNPNSPFILFDSRVTPLVPHAIRGVIWYQGESNGNEASLYRRLMPLMIRDWRRTWGQGDFSFLQVQLANYQAAAVDPGPSDWAELREAQLSALSEPNTGLAVTIDVGDASDIHPKDKHSVGQRLARWALADCYGRGGLPSGPLYSRVVHEAPGLVRIHFRYAFGLKTREDGPVRQISIAGSDRKFVWAQSRVEGETLVVWHPEIAQPTAVRYAWSANPEGANLENAEGLPASPFRTDDWLR
jgi:sialate O-acetylesterase